jgi:hypothetical protein
MTLTTKFDVSEAEFRPKQPYTEADALVRIGLVPGNARMMLLPHHACRNVQFYKGCISSFLDCSVQASEHAE